MQFNDKRGASYAAIAGTNGNTTSKTEVHTGL